MNKKQEKDTNEPVERIDWVPIPKNPNDLLKNPLAPDPDPQATTEGIVIVEVEEPETIENWGPPPVKTGEHKTA